jgi:HEAT repeat protein
VASDKDPKKDAKKGAKGQELEDSRKEGKKAEYLARTESHRRAAMLIPAIGGKASVACKEIRSALVLRKSKRFRDKIVKLLQDSDEDVRCAAVWALGELQATSYAKTIAALNHAGEAQVVIDHALAVLKGFGTDGEKALDFERRRAAEEQKKRTNMNANAQL